MFEKRIIYLSEYIIKPDYFVCVPTELARTIDGMIAYFTWPIRSETIDIALKYPNGKIAQNIRLLSF
jgi:hypothetical protein